MPTVLLTSEEKHIVYASFCLIFEYEFCLRVFKLFYTAQANISKLEQFLLKYITGNTETEQKSTLPISKTNRNYKIAEFHCKSLRKLLAFILHRKRILSCTFCGIELFTLCAPPKM